MQDETLMNLEIRLVPPAGACGLVGPSNLLATALGVSRFLAAFVFGLIGWGWGVEAARAAQRSTRSTHIAHVQRARR